MSRSVLYLAAIAVSLTVGILAAVYLPSAVYGWVTYAVSIGVSLALILALIWLDVRLRTRR